MCLQKAAEVPAVFLSGDFKSGHEQHFFLCKANASVISGWQWRKGICAVLCCFLWLVSAEGWELIEVGGLEPW